MDTKRPHCSSTVAIANVARTAVSVSGIFSAQKSIDWLSAPIHQAKESVWKILVGYAENIRAHVEVADPVSPLLHHYEHLADLILSIRNADEIRIHANENVSVWNMEIAPIEIFESLQRHQLLILEFLALYESLKTPPYRMPGQHFGDLAEENRRKTSDFDRKAFLAWIVRKRRFDWISNELSHMSFAKNGTLLPGYLQEIK